MLTNRGIHLKISPEEKLCMVLYDALFTTSLSFGFPYPEIDS